MPSVKRPSPYALPVVATLGLCVVGCFPLAPEPLISVGLTAAQEGSAAFTKDEMRAAIRHPLAKVHEASLRALSSWNLKTEVVDLNEKRGVITAREQGGRLIEINTIPVSSVVTSLRIKVGFWGDQPVSRLLLDDILADLGAR